MTFLLNKNCTASSLIVYSANTTRPNLTKIWGVEHFGPGKDRVDSLGNTAGTKNKSKNPFF